MFRLGLVQLIVCSAVLAIIQADDSVISAGRLPTNVQPDLYVLTLAVNHERMLFNGNLTIIIQVINSTDRIHLHAKDIQVDWYDVILQHGDRSIALQEATDQKNSIIQLKFRENLPVGRFSLTVTFSGQIRRDISGLYAISQSDRRLTIATALYPTKARTVFPCFDEPKFKAKFQLNLRYDQRFIALSNAPEIETKGPYDSIYYTKFSESVRMSTYSFGFIIGQFVNHSTPSQRVHVFANSADEVIRTLWYQKVATKAVNILEQTLGVSFQLKNIKLVATANKNEIGASGWGLIKIPEYMFYYDENNTRDMIVSVHQQTTGYIVNQLVRNWFSDSISPKWWDYIWFSDGLAKYFEYITVGELNPDWRLREQFLVNENHPALLADVELETVALNAVPSDDTYGWSEKTKAGPIVRMLEAIFGRDALSAIIQKYVQTFSGSVSTVNNLYDIMQRQVNSVNISLPTSVKEVLDSWINIPGYPVIKLTRHYGDSSVVTIVQRRFVPDMKNTSSAEWPKQYIPVTVSSKESPNFNSTVPSLWLNPNAPNVSYTIQPAVSPGSWIIVNNQEMGFFRVNYDRSNWMLLKNALARPNFDNIPVLNRAQLIDDSFNLAKSGERTFDIAFGVLNYLRAERDFIPWRTASRSLAYLERMLRGQPNHQLLSLFIQNITKSVYNLIPITQNLTDHVTRLQRLDVGAIACKAGLLKCVNEAKLIIEPTLKNPKLIMPEVQEIVFCTAIKFADNPNNLAKLIMQHILDSKNDITSDKEELYRIVGGLGCLEDYVLLLRYLEFTTMVVPPGYNVELTKTDRQTIFNAILSGNYMGTKAALAFLRRSFPTIETRYESMVNLLESIGPFIVTEELKLLFIDALTRHKLRLTESMKLAADRSLKIGDENISWLKSRETDITKWLTDNVSIEPPPSRAVGYFANAFTTFVSVSILLLSSHYFQITMN